ncbi:aldehyde dehydrogenase family protein [Mycobacterium genavense]|uniref:aldehyde dehydrogenase family protein n=1 Tax=Mycobacterium genavense TaxID=36812 RepID=UPI0004715DB1|nr:aldehyde dehydrogenase family protein [Mycobacterium genavense]
MTASAPAPSSVDFDPETRLYIDGQLRPASTGAVAENVNPASEEVLGMCADAGKQDMEEAIAAARRAFDTTEWATDHAFRQHCLMQLHDALQQEKERMRAELVAEVGCPVSSTYIAQLDWPLADSISWPARYISEFAWERDLPDAALMGVPNRRKVLKEPVGVVAAITPWNFPVEIIVNKLGPILATGNTVVLKPAVETPWSALRWGRIIAEQTDIPAGVVNIVVASDNSAVQLLVTDPRVDMVSFTGSTAVGQLIRRMSAETMKRNLLELGGKSAYIVLDDADLDIALPGCVGALIHSGQGCALATRMLVPRQHYEQAVEVATSTFSAVGVGDPGNPATFCGPLVSARQRDRVLGYIEAAAEQGGRVTAGGGAPTGLDRGYLVAPTVIADVEPGHRIFQEEVFGPVLSITAYEGGDDGAVALANDSAYGLSGAVMGSPERAMAVARRVRTGTFNINGGLFYGADAPFGGYKMSGVGRQNGHEGFEQHLQTKSIGFPASDPCVSRK